MVEPDGRRRFQRAWNQADGEGVGTMGGRWVAVGQAAGLAPDSVAAAWELFWLF